MCDSFGRRAEKAWVSERKPQVMSGAVPYLLKHGLTRKLCPAHFFDRHRGVQSGNIEYLFACASNEAKFLMFRNIAAD